MSIINAGKILQEIVVPELRDIKTDVATIKIEIKRLDEKIDSGLARLDEKIDSGLARLNEKIDNMDKRINARIDGLGTQIDGVEKRIDGMEKYIASAIDIHERLAVVEAKVGFH